MGSSGGGASAGTGSIRGRHESGEPQPFRPIEIWNRFQKTGPFYHHQHTLSIGSTTFWLDDIGSATGCA
jgi:hypothetical protein